MSTRRSVSVFLWVGAFFVAVALGYFQRTTGPTYPLRGSVSLGGSEVSYRLPRTHGGDGGLQVRIPGAGNAVRGVLEWRRFPTEDRWETVEMKPSPKDGLAASIPHQDGPVRLLPGAHGDLRGGQGLEGVQDRGLLVHHRVLGER